MTNKVTKRDQAKHLEEHGGRLSFRHVNGHDEIYCMIDGITIEILPKGNSG